MYDIFIAVSKEYEILRKDDELLVNSLEKRGLKVKVVVWDDELVNWSETNAVLITSTWDYTRKIKDYLDWVKFIAKDHILINPLSVILSNYDKHYLFCLNELGILIPETYIVKTIEDYRFASTHFKDEVVVKPVISAGGRNTFKININDTNFVEEMLKRHQVLMVQEYLKSIETVGEFSTIQIDQKIIHTIQKRAAQGEFRIQSHYLGIEELVNSLDEKQQAFIDRIIKHIPNEALYARIDFCLNNQNQYVLMELEMIEPSLFLEHNPLSADLFADAIIRKIRGE